MNALRKIALYIFGLYGWLVLVLCVLFGILSALLVPTLHGRRKFVTAAAKGVFKLTGIHCQITGLDNIPDEHCVVIANHSSYLDGIILQAFLPPRFAFVIKGEMQKMPFVHFMLRRIGSKFVERFIAEGSARDARAIVKSAQVGESIAFFPEGTFVLQRGLGRFRSGAFSAAIKGALPVVPVIIKGAREMMPANRLLPVPGRISVEILEAIPNSDPAYRSTRKLSALARKRMLLGMDEPDLMAEDIESG